MSDFNQDWDAGVGLYGSVCQHQGIHTVMPQGDRVHALRENAAKAEGFLGADDPAKRERAAIMLRAVLAEQETDPTSKHFGIWGYYLEEPPEAMAPADWNWADFLGLTLCKVLHRHAEGLDDALRADARAALSRAAYAIFRRNVGSGYTNIAVKGAVVTACAGHLLDDPFLAAYGARRMQRWVDHTRAQGINEYNSPTYNWVAVIACEAGLEIAPDGLFRDAALAGHRLVWTSLAEHYHQPTAQVAGPMSRCYSDLLKGNVATAIEAAAIAEPPTAAHPCPEDLRHHFRAPVSTAIERHHNFQAARGERDAVVGTTWLDGAATLSSINRDSLWWQRRCLLAYWNGDAGPVVAKLRVLKDERDWASTEARIVQAGPRALFGVTLLTDQGDHHVHLDRPDGGRFPMTAVRLRIELLGEGVQAQATDGYLELRAGDHRLVIHPGAGAWGEASGEWTRLEIEGGMALELALSAPTAVVDPATAPPLRLAAALELLPCSEAVSAAPSVEDITDDIHLNWADHGLDLHYPTSAQPYR